jgi:hypothetical protein
VPEKEKGTTMNKKVMLLALAMASLFALPAAASATEAHVTGVTSFTGTGGAASTKVGNEPESTAVETHISGSFDSGSSTTGTMVLDFTEVKAHFLGITTECHTAGLANGRVKTTATFHFVTTSTSKPGILFTLAPTTSICASAFRTEAMGNVIGTISSPECGKSSFNLSVSFASTGATQNDIEYTGTKYDLVGNTESSTGATTGSPSTQGLNANMTFKSNTEGTLSCT